MKVRADIHKEEKAEEKSRSRSGSQQRDEFDEEPNATVTELSGLAAARRRLARATARRHC